MPVSSREPVEGACEPLDRREGRTKALHGVYIRFEGVHFGWDGLEKAMRWERSDAGVTVRYGAGKKLPTKMARY